MKMNMFFLYFLFLLQIQKLKGRSEKFYECINLNRTVGDSSICTSIKIPDSEGYKCCSMKITFNNNISYNCFALEKKYSTSQEALNEYMSKKRIASLFNSVGGQMEIECGDNLKMEEKYKKLSDEYLNCYNNHIEGIEDENSCTKNNIPASEGCKCCYVETLTQNSYGNIINDKRCYIIQDKYFTNNKNLNDYLLDDTNTNSLNKIKNVNITISCKNYNKFYFQGSTENNEKEGNIIKTDNTDKTDDGDNTENILNGEENSKINPLPSESDSGSKAWIVIIIIVGIVLLIGITIVIIYCIKRKKQLKAKKTADITNANIMNKSTN